MAKLAERLKYLRHRGALPQEKIATDLGVTAAAISDIETGKRFPRVSLLIKIANYFETSTDFLLGRVDFEGDLKSEVKELYELAVQIGRAGELKDFFRWLHEKEIVKTAPRKDSQKGRVYKVPDGLTRGDVKALFSKYPAPILKKMARLSDRRIAVLIEEIAKNLVCFDLGQNNKTSIEDDMINFLISDRGEDGEDI